MTTAASPAVTGASDPDTIPHGSYHRRFVVIPEDGRVRAGMEDENHRMEMTVFHDGTCVTDIQAETVRIPWNLCPGAPDKLRELIGVPLQRMNRSTGHNAKEHCTHLFDLMRLAMARAAINTPVQYDVAIPDRIDKKTRAELKRDGKFVMAWDAHGYTVTGPDPFTGHALLGAPVWPEGLDDDTLEAALILRRVFLVATAREPIAAGTRSKPAVEIDFPAMLKAGKRTGYCFSFQADRVDQITSNYNWRYFADHRDDLLAGFAGARSLAEMSAS